jgi:predicted small secreted protein
MTLQRLQVWACVVVGAMVLSGCNAVAQDGRDGSGSSSALSMEGGGAGGVLACTGDHNSGGQRHTAVRLTNHNDTGIIYVNRLVAYFGQDGSVLCDSAVPPSNTDLYIDAPGPLGPHQVFNFRTILTSCMDKAGPVGGGHVTFVVYWSHAKGGHGRLNPLLADSMVTLSNTATNEIINREVRPCTPLIGN